MSELIERFLLSYVIILLIALGIGRFISLYLESRGSKYSHLAKNFGVFAFLYAPSRSILEIIDNSQLFPNINLNKPSSVTEWILYFTMSVLLIFILGAPIFYLNKWLDRRNEKQNNIISN